jgi:hypothetical protein
MCVGKEVGGSFATGTIADGSGRTGVGEVERVGSGKGMARNPFGFSNGVELPGLWLDPKTELAGGSFALAPRGAMDVTA